MLDHKDGVSQIAKIVQNVDQLRSIAAVESDRRFVEDVQRADQARPKRCCQLDTLRLAAGKGGGHAA